MHAGMTVRLPFHSVTEPLATTGRRHGLERKVWRIRPHRSFLIVVVLIGVVPRCPTSPARVTRPRRSVRRLLSAAGLRAEQGEHAAQVGYGRLADDIAGDAELICLNEQLAGHLLVTADERERRAGDIVCGRAANPGPELLDNRSSIAGDPDHLDQRLDDGPVARPARLIPDELQLPSQVGIRPSDLVPVAVRQSPAESGQADHVGVNRCRPQDQRVPAADSEPDPVPGWQASQQRAAQLQVPAFESDFSPPQQRPGNLGKLGQPCRSLGRRRPVPADVCPLARGVPRARCAPRRCRAPPGPVRAGPKSLRPLPPARADGRRPA